MKKFLTLSLLSVLLLSSCSTIEENELMNPVTEENELIAPSSKYLTVEEAAQKAKAFMDFTSSNKRESRGSKEFEVKRAKLIDFGKESRSAEIPDSAFYAVDFEDGGYSIVAAERDLLNNIYFYTEEGEFSLEGSPIMELYLTEAAKTMDQAPHKSNVVQDVVVKSRAKADPDPDDKYIKGEEWINGVLCIYYYKSTESKVDPITKTKWGQSYPYNYYCPKINGISTYVGCVAVAMGQIAATHRWPESFNGHNYNWDEMLSLSTHTSIYNTGANDIAQFLYDIGSHIGMNYGTSGSGANIDQALKGLKDMGYVNSVKANYTSSLCTPSISFGNPVYMQGFKEDFSVGHAWVVDGYNVINNWVEYYRKDNGELYAVYGGRGYTYLHFNLGWNGSQDGYYLYSSQAEGFDDFNYNSDSKIIYNINRDSLTN